MRIIVLMLIYLCQEYNQLYKESKLETFYLYELFIEIYKIYRHNKFISKRIIIGTIRISGNCDLGLYFAFSLWKNLLQYLKIWKILYFYYILEYKLNKSLTQNIKICLLLPTFVFLRKMQFQVDLKASFSAWRISICRQFFFIKSVNARLNGYYDSLSDFQFHWGEFFKTFWKPDFGGRKKSLKSFES